MADEDDDIAGFLVNEERRAQGRVFSSLDDDPEKGARAIQLAEVTGVPPAVVHGDLEHYDNQTKAKMSGQLVSTNQFLKGYINSHDLAATVSNDDLGQLDQASQSIRKIGNRNLAAAFIEGFGKGAGPGGFGSWIFNTTGGEEFVKKHPYSAIAYSFLGAPYEAFRVAGGVISGSTEMAGQWAQDMGFPNAAKHGEQFGQFIQDPGFWASIGIPIPKGQATAPRGPGLLDTLAHNKSLEDAIHSVDLYVRSGKEPPVGLHHILDMAKLEQMEMDIQNLGEALKESQKSATKERSADLYAEFARQHPNGNMKIGLSAEKVVELYGDKLPAPDDNILGWVPRIAEQLETAKGTGLDIEVPLADFLARVDPKIAKELEDHVRMRPEGVTKEEAKLAKEGKVEESPVEQRPVGFTTAKGSVYDLHEDGTTTRNKAARSDVGHEGDSGLKPRTERTIYVDDHKLASALSAAGLEGLGPKGARVIIKDGKASMLTWNEKAGKWGRSPESTDVAVSDLPAVDKAPLELWKRTDDVPGYEAYGGMHAGNQITELRHAEAIQPPIAPVDVVRKTAGLEPFEVYHGSPFDFDAFSMEKIGTGEGAQSYGHGLYLAENPKVSKGYQERLGGQTIEGKPLDKTNANHVLADYMSGREESYKGELLKTITDDIAEMERTKRLGDVKQLAMYKEMKTILEENRPLPKFDEGVHYRVRIKANKEHFLDWDKPLGEQSPTIKAAIEKLPEKYRPRDAEEWKEMTGEQLYKKLNYDYTLKAADYEQGAPATSKALHEAGIPGIKYLDQGSRVDLSTIETLKARLAEFEKRVQEPDIKPDLKKHLENQMEGIQEALEQKSTSNFVLFDDKLAEITHKNDVPVNQPKRVKPQQLSLDLPKQLDERDPFQRGTLIGVADYDRYLRLIEQRQAEDLAHATKKAEALARKQMTTAWKEDEIAIRAQVVEDLNRQPVFSADTFFRDGTFADERVEGSHRIGTDFLTREEQAALPPSYTAKNGIDPDTVAWRHGYSSGQDMVNDLIGLDRQREASGKNPAAYRRASIDAEVSRRMDLKYGEAKKSMLEDAKDQALSDIQIDLLHEETLGMAMKAGVEFELSKGDIAAMVKERMDVTLMSEANSDKMLAAAGRAGRAEASALLKEDYAEAFRQRAKKEFDAIIAKQTMEIEKARDSFDKTAKTFRARSLPSVAQEYTNAIHDVLMRVGERVNRSVQDLAEEMKRDGHDSLADFIKAQAETTFGGVQIPIPEFLLKPEWRGTIDQLTTEEFKQVKETVDVLNKLGRDELKIIRGGESADKAALLAEMKEKVQTFPLRGVKDFTGTPTLGQKITELPRSGLASSTAMETLFHRFDRADPRGVFNKWLVYPLADAANNKNVLQRKYAKPYGELGPIEGKNKLVTSPLIEPMSITKENPQGNPVATFTRGNVQTMIYNAGNRAQWEKFAKGWNADPDTLMSWLHQNSTKEMWDRAQKQGDTLFKPLFEQVQDMYHRINGVAPEKIPLEKIQTPFGEYDGWYHPLIKDASREYYIDAEGNRISGQSKKQMGPGVFDNTDGFHVRTANGFTKSRTNAFYPIDLNADMIPIRLDQMIHDLAFREAIINAEKLLRDPRLRNDVAKHYGKEYSDGFLPYLKGIAGQADIPSKAYADAMRVSEYLRKNTIGTYIGFNPGTPAKHGPTALVMSIAQVGLRPFARAFAETSFEKGLNAIEMAVGKREFLEATRDLFSKSEFTNSSNLEFAMKNSEELQRRKRNWADTISGEHANIYGEGNLRDKVAEAGSAIVAESDMISAAPTWLAAYRTAMKENPVHGEAVDIANAAVRKAHGSTAVTNLPAIVRGAGPFGSWFTTVYGFFGTVMQRRIEIFHTLNDMYHLGKEGEIKEAGKKLSDAMWHTMTYVVWPTMVEEWVTGFTTDDRRGWGTHLLTASLHGLGSSVIFVRDMVHAITTGGDPNAGMITSVLHDHKKLLDDLKKGKKVFTKETAGKTVQEFITSFGLLTGLTPKELGILAHASIDLSTGQAKPKNFTEWRNLMMRGQTKSRVVK